MPLPEARPVDLAELLHEPPVAAPELPMAFEARSRRVPAEELMAEVSRPAPAPSTALPDKAPEEVEAITAQVLRAIVGDGEAALRPASMLFQDYQVRCRMAGLARPPLDLPAFTRRLSCARGGVFDTSDPEWADALALAEALPEDMMGAFLLVAGAAREGRPCPPDAAIAQDVWHQFAGARAAADRLYRIARFDRVPHRSCRQAIDHHPAPRLDDGGGGSGVTADPAADRAVDAANPDLRWRRTR